MNSLLTTKQKAQIEMEIKRFKQTGRLPKEDDVRRVAVDYWNDNPGASYIERGPSRELDPFGQPVELDLHPGREPISTEEADILAERRPEFEESLSPVEARVFALNIVGGMEPSETAQVLGVSPQRVSEAKRIIKQKAVRYTKERAW